jgi:hypothetical protein
MECNSASEHEIHCLLEPIAILRFLHCGGSLPNGYHETVVLDVLQRGHAIGYDFFRHGEIPFTVMDWACDASLATRITSPFSLLLIVYTRNVYAFLSEF